LINFLENLSVFSTKIEIKFSENFQVLESIKTFDEFWIFQQE